MGRPRSQFELNQAGMILKLRGDLEVFLTEYAERHQFRSVQELLTMLVKQFIKEHADEAPSPKKSKPTKSRRVNLKLTADLEARSRRNKRNNFQIVTTSRGLISRLISFIIKGLTPCWAAK